MTATSDQPWPEGIGPRATGVGPTAEPGSRLGSGPTSDDDSKEVAQEQAAQLKGHAGEAGQQVLSTASDQATDVATDARAQAQDLLGHVRGELGAQASTQRDKAVQGLRSLATQLRSMAEGGEQSGTATQLAQRGSQTSEQAAKFLAEREPSELVEEVRSFARRRPAAFLLGATIAGVVAGRLTRGMRSASSEDAQATPHLEPASHRGAAAGSPTRLPAETGLSGDVTAPSGKAPSDDGLGRHSSAENPGYSDIGPVGR